MLRQALVVQVSKFMLISFLPPARPLIRRPPTSFASPSLMNLLLCCPRLGAPPAGGAKNPRRHAPCSRRLPGAELDRGSADEGVAARAELSRRAVFARSRHPPSSRRGRPYRLRLLFFVEVTSTDSLPPHASLLLLAPSSGSSHPVWQPPPQRSS